jgi:hypothetical protein
MASLAIIPIMLPMLIAAMPAAEPMVTIGAELHARANGGNIIGYSASGTGCEPAIAVPQWKHWTNTYFQGEPEVVITASFLPLVLLETVSDG